MRKGGLWRKRGEEKKWEGVLVHNVSERQLEWGWPFPGQIRLACQDCLEGQIEALVTHTHTHTHSVSKQATHILTVNTPKTCTACTCTNQAMRSPVLNPALNRHAAFVSIRKYSSIILKVGMQMTSRLNISTTTPSLVSTRYTSWLVIIQLET